MKNVEVLTWEGRWREKDVRGIENSMGSRRCARGTDHAWLAAGRRARLCEDEGGPGQRGGAKKSQNREIMGKAKTSACEAPRVSLGRKQG